MVQKVRNDMYPSVSFLVADFNQIVLNSIFYNGEDNEITKSARNMQEVFNNSMIDFPPPEPAPVGTETTSPRARARKAEERPSIFPNRTAGWRQTRTTRAMRRQNRWIQYS